MDIFNKLQTMKKTQQQILKLISTIDEFKGKWTTVELQSNRYLKELEDHWVESMDLQHVSKVF